MLLIRFALLALASRVGGQFFQFQQGGGGINLEDLMGGAFGGGGGQHHHGGYEELPHVCPICRPSDALVLSLNM